MGVCVHWREDGLGQDWEEEEGGIKETGLHAGYVGGKGRLGKSCLIEALTMLPSLDDVA